MKARLAVPPQKRIWRKMPKSDVAVEIGSGKLDILSSQRPKKTAWQNHGPVPVLIAVLGPS